MWSFPCRPRRGAANPISSYTRLQGRVPADLHNGCAASGEDLESSPMAPRVRVRVREVDVFLRRVRTRMPFRYGKAEVTGQPYAHLRVRLEPEVTGVSAAALPPLWFDKRPGLTHEDTI